MTFTYKSVLAVKSLGDWPIPFPVILIKYLITSLVHGEVCLDLKPFQLF